jgi:hypothetical protein
VLQRHVEEITAAAGRIEHADLAQAGSTSRQSAWAASLDLAFCRVLVHQPACPVERCLSTEGPR